MADIVVTDLEMAVKTWLNAQTAALVGPSRPVHNGFLVGDVRSPAQGVIGVVSLGAGGVGDTVDARRVVLTLKAAGRQGPETSGPRKMVTDAANATARVFFGLTAPVQVTLPGGAVVVLKYVDAETAQGPTPAGDLGGEYAMTLDALVIAQEG